MNKKGIINIGGKSKSVFNFAKQYNKKVKKTFLKNKKKLHIPVNSSMNLEKINKILKL